MTTLATRSDTVKLDASYGCCMLWLLSPLYADVLLGVVHTLNQRSWSIVALAILLATLRVSGSVEGQEVTVRDNYFVEAEVDDETPYIGQQVTYTVKFYVAYPTDKIPTYRAPQFSGFMNQTWPTRQEYWETVDDRSYTVYQVSTILYPTMAGDRSIGSATMTVPEESCIDWPSARNCPGAYLPPEERGGADRFDYDTPSLKLTVQPLPPRRPGSFSGAVGRFSIDSAVNKVTTMVGDPITLRVTISGEGNIEKLPGPLWPKLKEWRSFDGAASHTVGVVNGRLVGSRSFELLMIPEVPGRFELPTIEYAYFDPDAEEYVKISTDPISVEVLPDSDTVNSASSVSNVDEAMDQEAADIQGIKPPPARIRSRSGSVAASPMFWSLWLLPVAGLLALAGTKVLQRMRRNGKGIESHQRALAQLTSVTPTTSTPDAAALALHGYLSALLGQSSTRLMTEDIVSRVRSLGVSDDTARLLASTLKALDESRFAGYRASTPAASLSNVAEVVMRIGREVSS